MNNMIIRMLGLGSGLLVLVLSISSTFLHWDENTTFWTYNKASDILIVSLLAAIAICAVIALFVRSRALDALVLGGCWLAFGAFVPNIAEYLAFEAHAEPGWIVAGVSAFAGLVPIALLTVSLSVGGSATSAQASSATPAGWYADPLGQANVRFWDGSRWTEQTG